MSKYTITTAEQQNTQKRMRDCDGCHDPANPPAFAVFVKVGAAGGGGVSESVFMICRKCAANPIALHLHGKGYCAPGVTAHAALGGATLVHNPEPETVEPEVEIIDNRQQWPDNEDEILEACGVEPRPRARGRARARREEPPAPTPASLDHCAFCGHERGFHEGETGRCIAPNYGRGCQVNCRGFVEK